VGGWRVSPDTSANGFPEHIREAARRVKSRRGEDDPIAEIAEAILQSDSEANREANS